jgi:toxin FitB
MQDSIDRCWKSLERFHPSVISFAEIRRGVELLPAGRRRERLATWLAEEFPARFEERILDIDQQVAETWGVVMARGQKIGLTLGSMDAFVAATAEAHNLTLATRNVKDFQRLGIALFDPWQPGKLLIIGAGHQLRFWGPPTFPSPRL